MNRKIESKEDLIRFIQGLPDGWFPTKCISWVKPEVVSMGIGYEEVEIRHFVEIEIEGQVERVHRNTSLT